jgi:hypothetical protein
MHVAQLVYQERQSGAIRQLAVNVSPQQRPADQDNRPKEGYRQHNGVHRIQEKEEYTTLPECPGRNTMLPQAFAGYTVWSDFHTCAPRDRQIIYYSLSLTTATRN